MDDNLSLSEKIKQRYRSMYTGVFYRRYILGLWAMAEGIIYDMFDAAKHVISNLSDLVNTNYYVSCDYGTQNATVFLLWCKERSGRWVCCREYYYSGRDEERQKTDSEYADDLERWLGDIKPVKIIIDIEGVGGVKVTPIWNGGGTVKLTIIASDYTVPTITLIGKVQKEIDSVAPIGHIVTVDGAAKKEIQIETNIVYQTGWSWKTSGNYIEKAIDAYFQELAKNWASSDQLIVRISQIETRILDCAGVIDISNTKINGNAENLILESNFIPVRGSVTDGA